MPRTTCSSSSNEGDILIHSRRARTRLSQYNMRFVIPISLSILRLFCYKKVIFVA
ncbi:hypothetical protein GIB67_034869 [Kingdonia uniflora]|uniref:Uncharacterized protein n=1 Tax=Kingdonia uniflora TaxID=39325 RepID=A0A7J7ME55_9MAGN|nr:hypothetical protein GIB67_034869 [Kingdonia uniflora]